MFVNHKYFQKYYLVESSCINENCHQILELLFSSLVLVTMNYDNTRMTDEYKELYLMKHRYTLFILENSCIGLE